MLVLDERRAQLLSALCDLIVPGSSRVGPEVYLDARLAGMDAPEREAALDAIDVLGAAADEGERGLAAHELSPEFGLLRALACEAFYSDFVAPGAAGPGAWEEIDFAPPLAARLDKDWSYLSESW